LVEVIEDQTEDLYFSWADDGEVASDEEDDTSSFGDSRYNVEAEDLRQRPALSPKTVADFAKALLESDVIADYELDGSMDSFIKKAQDLKTAFTPVLVRQEVLQNFKYGPITAIRGSIVTDVDERNTGWITATAEAVAAADASGIAYTKLPQALAKSRSELRAHRWWGVIPEAPKFEFYGATKKEVAHLVAIYRASQAETKI
jgi:hypothetical protein